MNLTTHTQTSDTRPLDTRQDQQAPEQSNLAADAYKTIVGEVLGQVGTGVLFKAFNPLDLLVGPGKGAGSSLVQTVGQSFDNVDLDQTLHETIRGRQDLAYLRRDYLSPVNTGEQAYYNSYVAAQTAGLAQELKLETDSPLRSVSYAVKSFHSYMAGDSAPDSRAHDSVDLGTTSNDTATPQPITANASNPAIQTSEISTAALTSTGVSFEDRNQEDWAKDLQVPLYRAAA